MRSRVMMIPATLAVALLIATVPAALAQPPGGPGGGPRGWHGPDRDGGHDLEQFLGLTEEQQTQWKEAHRSHFEALRPTFEKMRDLHDQMKAELDSASPDAATVGGYMISLHQLEGQMEASRADLDNALRDILTDEQETKFEAWKAAHPDPRRGGPGGWGGPHHDRHSDGGAPAHGGNA